MTIARAQEYDRVAHSRRQRFYERLLSRGARSPETDFPELCNAWREVSEADWVWLWIYNTYTKQWELTTYAPDVDAFVPKNKPAWPDVTSVSEYVNVTGRPEMVADIKHWRRVWNHCEFRVACADEMLRMGCRSFVCIPLLPPVTDEDGPARENGSAVDFRGSICLHYKDAHPKSEQPEKSLLLMGRLTSQAIMSSYQAEHRDILTELNFLAEKYLTDIRRRQAQVRTDYLGEVVKLIQRRLHVRAVSIFYQVPFENEIECLATTGLYDPAKKNKIANDDLSNVTYKTGEGLTGECFRTGEPRVLLRNETKDHTPKYVEMPKDRPLRQIGTCFYPIPLPPSAQPNEGAKALGVIRCAEHCSPFFRNQVRSFDPTQIKKLAFIARQIGPVLHTLAVRFQRELTVSIIKHDLKTPLNMIQDIADEIQTYIDKRTTIKYFDLMDIKTSAWMASKLVSQLDPDPNALPEFTPTQIFLEGDIIARLKNLLKHFAMHESGMTISFGNFRTIPPLNADRTLVERVFWNLLMNAIKYGNKGSAINVKPRLLVSGLFVDVENYGIGVAEEDGERVFQQFYRAPAAAQRKIGLGLGLSIARRAMVRHGGTLEILRFNDPTVFTMFFPNECIIGRRS